MKSNFMQLENGITTIMPVLSLVALAAASQAAPKTEAKADDGTTMKHHEIAGKAGEARVESGAARLIVEHWRECRMGIPHDLAP
jgi:hypothetical protein